MARWAAFFVLTVAVLMLLLALARLSQALFREAPPALPAGEGPSTDRSTIDAGPGGIPRRVDLAEPVITRREHGTATPPGPESPAELSGSTLFVNVAVTQGLFGAVLLVGAWYFGIPAWAVGVTGDPWSTGLPAVALGTGFGVTLWGANQIGARVADAAGAGYDERLREVLAPETAREWVVLLAGVLPIVAVAEEFLFRAAFIGVPAAGLGASPWALAVVSSFAFALGHGAQGRVGIVVTGGLGFALAAGYIVSGSLLVVVVAHYLVNALEFLVHEGIGIDGLRG